MSTVIDAGQVGLAEARDPLPPVRSPLWMRILPLVVAVASAVGLVVGIAWAGVAWERHRSFEGLKPGQPVEIADIPITREQSEFSVGVADLEFPGSEITVLNVSALTSPNVEYLGASTIWPADMEAADGWVLGPGAKVRGKLNRHPIDEVVPADATGSAGGFRRSVSVVANFRLASGDEGAINGLMVTYRIGDEVRTEVLRAGAVVCFRPGPIPRMNNGDESCFTDANGSMNGPRDEAILYRYGLLPEKDLGW